MRSGVIGIDNGRLRISGIDGDYWSLVASSTQGNGTATSSAYYLRFDASGVNPISGPVVRWFSLPLRCLSTV